MTLYLIFFYLISFFSSSIFCHDSNDSSSMTCFIDEYTKRLMISLTVGNPSNIIHLTTSFSNTLYGMSSTSISSGFFTYSPFSFIVLNSLRSVISDLTIKSKTVYLDKLTKLYSDIFCFRGTYQRWKFITTYLYNYKTNAEYGIINLNWNSDIWKNREIAKISKNFLYFMNKNQFKYEHGKQNDDIIISCNKNQKEFCISKKNIKTNMNNIDYSLIIHPDSSQSFISKSLYLSHLKYNENDNTTNMDDNILNIMITNEKYLSLNIKKFDIWPKERENVIIIGSNILFSNYEMIILFKESKIILQEIGTNNNLPAFNAILALILFNLFLYWRITNNEIKNKYTYKGIFYTRRTVEQICFQFISIIISIISVASQGYLLDGSELLFFFYMIEIYCFYLFISIFLILFFGGDPKNTFITLLHKIYFPLDKNNKEDKHLKNKNSPIHVITNTLHTNALTVILLISIVFTFLVSFKNNFMFFFALFFIIVLTSMLLYDFVIFLIYISWIIRDKTENTQKSTKNEKILWIMMSLFYIFHIIVSYIILYIYFLVPAFDIVNMTFDEEVITIGSTITITFFVFAVFMKVRESVSFYERANLKIE